jgi:PAS domain S-box-containing protein
MTLREQGLPEFDAHVLPDYSVKVDLNRHYIDVSDAFCEVLGYTRDELVGKRYPASWARSTVAAVFVSCQLER